MLDYKECPFAVESPGNLFQVVGQLPTESHACSLFDIGENHIPCSGICGQCKILNYINKRFTAVDQFKQDVTAIADRLDATESCDLNKLVELCDECHDGLMIALNACNHDEIYGVSPCPKVLTPYSSFAPEVSEDTFICTFCGHRHQKNSCITWVRSEDNERTFDWRELKEVVFCQKCYNEYTSERGFRLSKQQEAFQASFTAGSILMDKRAARLRKEKK